MVWLLNDINELELSFFFFFFLCNTIFHCHMSYFTTFCVDIIFLYILTFNAKCCKLLTSSVFVVRFVNDIIELELSCL